jgi:hypothetical protein
LKNPITIKTPGLQYAQIVPTPGSNEKILPINVIIKNLSGFSANCYVAEPLPMKMELKSECVMTFTTFGYSRYSPCQIQTRWSVYTLKDLFTVPVDKPKDFQSV